ncbi:MULTISPECIES: hypothetical protein [unclassified Bradyrhizobium]|uniref:hypothetical protein n=1 Tax=unclassified Bradyrhizobium TaxID=2631580 RepID=UPI0033952984
MVPLNEKLDEQDIRTLLGIVEGQNRDRPLSGELQQGVLGGGGCQLGNAAPRLQLADRIMHDGGR